MKQRSFLFDVVLLTRPHNRCSYWSSVRVALKFLFQGRPSLHRSATDEIKKKTPSKRGPSNQRPATAFFTTPFSRFRHKRLATAEPSRGFDRKPSKTRSTRVRNQCEAPRVCDVTRASSAATRGDHPKRNTVKQLGNTASASKIVAATVRLENGEKRETATEEIWKAEADGRAAQRLVFGSTFR